MEDFFTSITPESNFNAYSTPPSPNYNSLDFWSAHPDKSSYATLQPDTKTKNSHEVDCFYVHPTGFYLKEWNAPLDLENSAYDRVDLTLATQASAYSSVCNIYAPHYRQATYAAIATNQADNSLKALNLAYEDIKNAFDYYLKNFNQDKPFILASHSQGSLHCQRLITEKAFKNVFKSRMIAAYLIGYPLEKKLLIDNHYKVSGSPIETGCIIQFCTVGVGASSLSLGGIKKRLKYWKFNGESYALDEINDLASTNPVSWDGSQDWSVVPKESFIMPRVTGKSVYFNFSAVNKTSPKITEIKFAADQNMDIRLRDDGLLESKGSTIERILKRDITGNRDLHIWDYQLFWGQIRENSQKRVKEFLKNNG